MGMDPNDGRDEYVVMGWLVTIVVLLLLWLWFW